MSLSEGISLQLLSIAVVMRALGASWRAVCLLVTPGAWRSVRGPCPIEVPESSGANREASCNRPVVAARHAARYS